MNGEEIRRRFVSFFSERGHTPVVSSGLIPRNDPTLLFTNAGMTQFKGLFLGEEKREYVRAVTCQKCVRAGGKHNDLENVGRTARHHTFFEMLGNFSFGDYFKEAAIPLAWEFVTGWLGLDPERLLVTVYVDDDEAASIWQEKVGLPASKVIRIAGSDNFWSMGPTGPCGPCSEIFYDHGPEVAGGPPGSETADGDRFVEIWNLVFMQYDRSESGSLTPLPKPCIDTGAGLERIAAILQGKHSNFDTDLFQPLIQAAATLAGVEYRPDRGDGVVHPPSISLRVIADHLRAVSFLIADGVLPSNEGRGYVLRRIMRRAMRHGRMLGLERSFLHQLVPVLVRTMGESYPELVAQARTLAMVIETEERRFAATLGSGLKILEGAIASLAPGGILNGEMVFTLYDTYGFPVDLTADILRDRGFGLDLEGFERRMGEQRARARAAWAGSGDERISGLYHDLRGNLGATEFLGYVTESAEGVVLALLRGGAVVGRLATGEEGMVVANQTPFYGESGGQVGDVGNILGEGFRFEVSDTQRPLPDLVVHIGRVVTGELVSGVAVRLEVDGMKRAAIRRHHSTTHLLHHALHGVLGQHVKQAGSMVSGERLRFDFSHFQGMTVEELAEVEARVNRAILANHPQETTVTTPTEAVALGARALFGEKYGDEVRVVRLGESLELCGGTHVTRTGDIGLFRLLSEGAVGAGVRRIEGVSGEQARQSYLTESKLLRELGQVLKVPPLEAVSGVMRLLARQRELEHSLGKAKAAASGNLVEDLVGGAVMVAGVTLLTARVAEGDPKGLRDLLDRLRDRLGSSVILLGAVEGEKVALVAGVSPELTKRVKAGELMRFVSALV
ncbi:MAG: alanine--tRNA ligase, partial [Magnetococcales bacterium]|nr:alanine--tRNA ligase [Magnetococcales bacterium]